MAVKKKATKVLKPEIRKQIENKVMNDVKDAVTVDRVIGTDFFNINQGGKQCSVCGNILPIDEFQKSRSQIFFDKKVPICNGCISVLIEKYYEIYKDVKDALYIVCSITNTIIIKECVDDTLKDIGTSKTKRKDIFNIYISYLDKYIIDNSTWNKTYMGFESSNFSNKPFKKTCVDDTLTKLSEDNMLDNFEEEQDENLDDDIELSPIHRKRLVKKWGDKDDVDLIWLDEREKSYYNTHDIPNDHINKSGVITLCNLELQEFKTLCDGGDVKKILDSKSRVLSTVTFSPKKKAKEEDSNNALDLGSLIKKREEYSPIINDDPLLDDVDNIRNISKALAGALCRTANIDSPLVGEFEKVMKEYTFEFSSDVDIEDE